MKIKKILCSLALASSASLSLTPIASCSGVSKYSNQVQSVVNKLVEMNKYPRCTSVGQRSNLDAIRVWIIKEAINSGIPYVNIHTDGYGNIWFDVPATENYETYKPMIIQGHMDMVVAGLTDELKAKTPIETEVDWDKGIVHSKDYKTSLGADNGVSLAIIFTLLQDSSFKHGRLRVIFTADEDSGMIGAGELTEMDYLFRKTGPMYDGDDILYLLNLDAEGVGEVYRSCFGSETYTYSSNDTSRDLEEEFENHLCFDIRGFKGGHSGGDIPLKRASAEKCIYELLNELDDGNNIQIIKHWHPDEKGDDISFARNQIVPHAQIWFNTSLDKEKIQEKINTKISEWKTNYSGEDWNNVKITLSDLTLQQDHTKYLSAYNSSTIIENIGNNNDATKMGTKGLWYGSQSENGETIKSANISPVEIEYQNNDKFKVNVVCQVRTKTTDLLKEMKAHYEKIQLFDFSVGSVYPAWEYNKTKQKFLDDVANEYKKESIEPKILDSTGGMENAFWDYINPNLNCTSIGPTIEEAHSVKETLRIDSIQPVINVVKRVCELMKN